MSAGIVTLIAIAGLSGCYAALVILWMRKNRPPLDELPDDKIARKKASKTITKANQKQRKYNVKLSIDTGSGLS